MKLHEMKAEHREQASQPSPGLTPPAVSYIAGVVGAALLSSVLVCLDSPPTGLQTILIWTLVALMGEMMTFQTVSQRAQVNLATATHLGMVLALDPGQIVPVMLLSRGISMFVIQRKVWYRAAFNVSQVTLALLAASSVFHLLMGPTELSFRSEGILRFLPPFLVGAVLYYAINTGSVSGIVALTTRDSVWRVWRENYGYGTEVLSTLGLVMLGPVLALCYLTAGFVGLLVFLAPMGLVRFSSVRYIALRRSQQALVSAERLAAKGEIAAEVGHDIGNFLHGISAQMYFLQAKRDGVTPEELERRLGLAMDQIDKINTLSESLMQFGSGESSFAPTHLGQLVRQTIGFLEPQRRFDRVQLELDLDERVGEVLADHGQLQQVLMNLMINAANVMSEHSTEKPRIWVTLRQHDSSNEVELMVADSGPGVPSEVKSKIFEPGFTTRTEGHGFGLSTVYRVVTNHGGTVAVEDDPAGGALFRIKLPQRAAMEKAA